MKKNESLKQIRRNLIRRGICLIIVLAMFFNCFPAEGTGSPILDLIKATRKVFASGEPVTLDSTARIAEYCADYDASHAEDTIIINIADAGSQGEIQDYISIGHNEEDAFRGTIKVNPNMVFNLSCAMFNYISDEATIVDLDGNPVTLTITRTRNVSDEPLFAKHVVSTRSSGMAEWSFRFSKYQQPDTEEATYRVYNFAGYIGAIESDAKVNITSIIHDNMTGTSVANIQSSENVGLVCGTLGSGAKLKIDSISVTSSSNGSSEYTVKSTNGNAGGLVGSMGDGSHLILGTGLANPQASGKAITSDDGYAGGIVGKVIGGTIEYDNSSAYVVAQNISGKSGAGGIAGYYSTVSTTDSTTDRYTVATGVVSISSPKVNGAGNCGGLFGEVVNDGDMTISGSAAVTVDHSSGAANTLGGLIGNYSAAALTDSLVITQTGNVSPSRTGGSAKNYGGLIGYVDGAAYINVQGITTSSGNATGTSNFGGVIGSATQTFVEISGTNTISYSGNSDSNTFGGVVGDLGYGVLYLQGTTDLSGAPAVTSATATSGQVVGRRDSALVFAADGWHMTRPTNNQQLDDVGSWGEVVRFNSTTFKQSDILSINGSGHYVTLLSAVTSMSDLTDFAKTALNIQHNDGLSSDTGVLRASGSSSSTLLSSNLSLTGSSVTIDLRGTGITGLTRDSGSDCVEYSGTFNGNGGSVILAAGESYDTRNKTHGNGRIYRHQYIGLFGKTSGASISNLNIDASSVIDVYAKVAAKRSVFVGNVVGQASGALTLSGVEVKSGATLNHAGGGTADVSYFGGLVGSFSSAGTVSITGCSFGGTITGNSDESRIGGIAGSVRESNSFGMTITNTDVGGSITSNGTNTRTGGVIGTITTTGNAKTNMSNRRVTINGLDIDGLTMSVIGKSGGFLGYSWYETEVVFAEDSGLEVKNSSSIAATDDTAGLVYAASGYWNVNKDSIKLSSMSVDSSGESFGLLINKGYYDADDETWGASTNTKSSAIYLELAPGAFTVSNANVGLTLNSVTVFDELVAYSSVGGVMNNGQGIVSINTYDGSDANSRLLKMGNDDAVNTGLTYEHKTAFLDSHPSLKVNPNTRYYYNLDDYRTSQSNAKEQLLIWSVDQYAHPSIQSYFTSTNTIGTDGTTDIDLRGYSYYPVDLTGSLTITGELHLYNTEFDQTESGVTDVRLSNDSSSQHYMIHNSLLRNVSGTLTVNNLTLDGNVNKIDGLCGALVMGNVGSSASANPATININGLVLSGVRIDNYNNYSAVAPLIINTATGNSTFNIRNVSNDASYSTETGYIASSLLGDIGTATAKNVKVTFEGIKLDGRNTSGVSSLPDLGNVYGTPNGCLFTKATLINKLAYADNSGSFGVYNYTLDEDWGENGVWGGPRNVTYGAEINSTVENREAGDSKQLNYKNGWSNPYYTRPDDHAYIGTAYTSFATNFINYVSTGYNDSDNTHELRVNIQAASDLSGCGTYNDPYLITKGDQLVYFADIINGEINNIEATIVPSTVIGDNNLHESWCSGPDSETVLTIHESGVWYNADRTKSISDTALRKYLAGAYYKIDPDLEGEIELSSDFNGFANDGNTMSAEFAFRGVIDGSGKTIINKSNSPLIVSSNGSVVKKLNLVVKPVSTKTLTQGSSNKFDYNNSCEAYGAVIAKIHGGDNIIDEVSVDFSDTSVKIIDKGSASYAKIVPIGGYVGVVINGGLIFRNMTGKSGDHQAGLTAGNLSGFGTDDPTAQSTTKWLYINPIIGRVMNGYAITESDSYRPFEDGLRTYPDGTTEYWHGSSANTSSGSKVGVTMRNGIKNYSITDINTGAANFTMMLNGSTSGAEGSTVTVSNAQSLFIISLITESGLGTSANGKYDNTNNKLQPYKAYMATHLAQYNNVGKDNLDQSDSDYVKAANDIHYTNDLTTKVPYLIKTYTPKAANDTYPAFNLAAFEGGKNELYLKMTFSNANGAESSYYMPDGFRGLGSLMFQNGTNTDWANTATDKSATTRIYNAMFLSELNGNDREISLNMNLSYYSDDNYTTPSRTQGYMKTGYGFFNALRSTGGSDTQNQIKDLTLIGNVKLEVMNDSGVSVYDNNGISPNARPAVGGLIGAPGVDTNSDGGGGDMYIKNVSVNNLYVQGVRYTGGFIGCSNANAVYTFYNCSADNLKILGGTSTGGLIGYVRHTQSKINADFCGNDFGIISIVSRSTWNAGNNDGTCSVGGLFGDNYAANEIGISVSNVTIKNASSVEQGYVGYSDVTNNTTTPKAGGVIGAVDRPGIANLVSLDHVKIENINVASGNSGGMIGLVNGYHSIDIRDCEVVTDNAAVIKNLYGNNDSGSSGGLIGYSNAGVATATTTIIDTKIKNYEIAGYRNCGGLVGQALGGANPDIVVQNVSVSGAALKVNQQGGGLIARLNSGKLLGYNILINDMTIARYSGSGSPTYSGYIVGLNNNKTVQLVGFSRQGTISTDKTVGSPASDKYGTDGYVIFADYNNTASDEDPNVKFSNLPFIGTNIGLSPSGSKTTKIEYKVVAVRQLEKNDITNNITVLAVASSEVKSVTYGAYDPSLGDEQRITFSGGDRFRYQSKYGSRLRWWKYTPSSADNSLRLVNGVISGRDDNADGYDYASTTDITLYNDICSSYLGEYKDNKNAEAVELFVITQDVKENTYAQADNKDPYVTTNPRTDITATQWLTSDGVSNTSYPDSAAQKIITDMRSADGSTPVSASLKRYQDTGISNADRDELASMLSKNMLTISQAVTSSDTYGGEDFPVLVIDDLTTANDTVNNYLKLLTNTDYDFYNGYSNGTEYSGTDKSVYNLDISKWKYNSSTGEFEKQSGAASLKCDANTRFYIMPNEVDNLNWQISLIDVQFYDPANLPTFNGTSRTNDGLIAYHLYVPVVVKKMLHYTVSIRPSSGTTYNLDSYPDSVVNLVENLGNPMTVKITYTYQRSAGAWEDAINNGESVYRNYDKAVTVKSWGNVFPDDAIAVLVDPNNNADRFYSGDFSASGILDYYSSDTGSSTYKLILSDSNGSTPGFDTVKMNDIMNISLDNSEEAVKNLVEWQSGDPEDIVAEVNTGSGAGTLLRMKRSGETGTYAVNVSFPANQTDGSYLQENYYLSLFTKVDSTDNEIYHYEVSNLGNSFGDPNYPSARIGNNEVPHLIIGNLFTNEIEIEALNSNRLISTSNDTLTARLTAHVGFTPNAISKNIDTYITNDNVKLYQTFMVSLNKLNGQGVDNERGILANPAEPIERTDYEVGSSTGIEDQLLPHIITDSYIELPSRYNIKNDLLNAVATYRSTGSGNTVDITETVALRYLESTFGIQFPQSDESSNDKGTYMIGYSNISSSPNNGAASRASSNTDDQVAGRLLYYITDDSTVKVSYNVTTNDVNYIAGNGNYGQLGLDGNELDKKGLDREQINTAIYYNIYDYSNKTAANYVKINIELLSKVDGYSTPLDIPTYLDDFKVLDKDNNEITADSTNIISKPRNGIYTYIVPLEDLYTSSDDAYLIPIQFKPYSGNNSLFEGSNLDYSNYKVKVTVGLLRNKSMTETVLSNSDGFDHVIYTNAKLYSDIIE